MLKVQFDGSLLDLEVMPNLVVLKRIVIILVCAFGGKLFRSNAV